MSFSRTLTYSNLTNTCTKVGMRLIYVQTNNITLLQFIL